jgi:hypothetical protein
MRRLPGPAGCRLGDGVKTPEAPFGLFRDWQRTPTQSSVRTLRSLRLQMDVRFCEMQEPPAERHCCVTTDSDSSQMRALPSAPGDLVFPLDNSTTWRSAIRKFRRGRSCRSRSDWVDRKIGKKREGGRAHARWPTSGDEAARYRATNVVPRLDVGQPVWLVKVEGWATAP